MGSLITIKKNQEEGYIFNSILRSRLIENNKNLLTACTGPTGSSKSYQDMKRAEIWYRHYFNEEFPAENICFSIDELMKRITSKELRRGEILIFEEAGANMGSLDFQNKVSKLFSYVLQSFRSMNIGVFFNLPYLSMLNKQARMLIHIHFETCGINYDKKIAKSRAYFLQTNQGTGKIYRKLFRIKKNGRTIVVRRFNYGMPSAELVSIYETKKLNFVSDFNETFKQQLDEMKKEAPHKSDRSLLTPREMEVYKLRENNTQKQVGEILNITPQAVSKIEQNYIRKGYQPPNRANSLRKSTISTNNSDATPI